MRASPSHVSVRGESAPPRYTRPVVIPLVDVKAQYAPLIPELKQRFADVLESGRFIFGPEVQAFEGGGAYSGRRTRSASRTAPTHSSSRSRRWGSAAATK